MNLFLNIVLWTLYLISLYFSIFILLVYLDKKNLFQTEASSSHPTRTPPVSILVPAYNEGDTIVHTLESLHQLEYPSEKLEIIVINDGSTDGTQQKVEEYIRDKPHFRLFSQVNKGKAAALNTGLSLAKGEFFACLDADSFVAPSTLGKMVSLYYKEKDPQLAIITPAMKVHHPKTLLQKVQWLEYLVIILIARLSSHLDTLYVAPGPFSLYRTNIIRKLGGFDEQNITEDQEIAYRVQQQHYRIKHCYDGYVYTTAPHQLKPFYWQRKRWYLGSLRCLYQYRNIIGNKRYGDFGIIQMIKNMGGFFLALGGIMTALYFLFVPFFRSIKNLFLVHFDILPYLLNFKFHFTFLNFLTADFKKGFIILFLFLIGFFLFYQAHKNANERMTKWGLLPLLPYFAFYYLLKGIILLLTLIEFSRSKKTKW